MAATASPEQREQDLQEKQKIASAGIQATEEGDGLRDIVGIDLVSHRPHPSFAALRLRSMIWLL